MNMNTTITLINNQEEVICHHPLYRPRVGSHATLTTVPSRIEAQPRSDLRFSDICYVQLKTVRKAVVIDPQEDGSIRIGGPNVDMIAEELELDSVEEAETSKNEWSQVLNLGWQWGK
jgi:hypothetical protein